MSPSRRSRSRSRDREHRQFTDRLNVLINAKRLWQPGCVEAEAADRYWEGWTQESVAAADTLFLACASAADSCRPSSRRSEAAAAAARARQPKLPRGTIALSLKQPEVQQDQQKQQEQQDPRKDDEPIDVSADQS